MSIEALIEQLRELRLRGMAAALEQQQNTADQTPLSFEARLGLILQNEFTERTAYRRAQKLRWSRLPERPTLEDVNIRVQRGLDAALFSELTTLEWMKQHLNLLITGPTGVGKSFLACTLGRAACQSEYSVRFFRLPKLIEELSHYAALQKSAVFFRQLSKVDLLILDDFGLTPLNEQIRNDLLEILDARYTKRSTLITSNLALEQWRTYLTDPTIADAILDRLVHNAHRLQLHGDSMRKLKAAVPEAHKIDPKPIAPIEAAPIPEIA